MEDFVMYYLRGGKPLSDEHRLHLSLALKGKKKSPEHRAAISKAIKDWWRERKEEEREREMRRLHRKRPPKSGREVS